jgi:predicted AlkP superfamily pyrophosphatase or phosphodiesterase
MVLLFLALGRLESAQPPRLVLYLSIDQMKAEYLNWYKGEFTGGFRRLTQEGLVFTNANLNYAPSETGPGHAALGTGAYPTHSGIPSNEWPDPKTGRQVYCVEDSTAGKVNDEGGGFSPRKLFATALGDWIKQSSPTSKVVAASIKDRAAILMAGQHPDYVFWYDRKSGHMVTSGYYGNGVPAWVQSFNASDWVRRNVPETWTKMHPESVYTKYGPDELEGEQKWGGSTSFPHKFQQEKKKDQFLTSPYGDMMLLDFAREAVRAEKLGQRGVTDVLLLSLSCGDYIGHAFGGNSHEVIDYLIRLDRALGDFIREMEQVVGKGNVLLALSADHACTPLPEYVKSVQQGFARRILVQKEIYPRLDEIDRGLQKQLSTEDRVIVSRAFLNYAAGLRGGLDSVALEHRVRDRMLKIDGIADVFFRRELLNDKAESRLYLDYYRRGYCPARGRDFIVLPCENCLFASSATGTSHGTPYPYDTHVPIIFWGNSIRGGAVNRAVHTVDIAPTIAKLLGIRYPLTVDGEPLREILP